jgi:PIN domain nuclease of toxin-antitoxin system
MRGGMRILLDTHCWLWMQVDPDRFSAASRRLIEDPGNELLLSAASSWEIAIKYHLGKLPLPESPTSYVPSRMQASGTAPLSVEHSHALQVGRLPDHHRDPFDRLLVSQAILENLVLLTADSQLEPYDVRLHWAR